MVPPVTHWIFCHRHSHISTNP